jgi:hypothetical protein
MNRQQRRAARSRKLKAGDVIFTSVCTIEGEYFWFERPENWTPEDGLPDGAELHGPFETCADSLDDQRLVLVGPQGTVADGGTWDQRTGWLQ